jgi:hypothetical protein
MHFIASAYRWLAANARMLFSLRKNMMILRSALFMSGLLLAGPALAATAE